MKVARQNISESYITTSGWVREFTNSLEKNADFLSNVKSVFKKRNAPKTIDEKMADIKARVGYGIVKSDKSHDSINVKEAKKQDDSCECCNSCAVNSPCDSQSKDGDRAELIRLMAQLIGYIEDFLADRPELSSGAVIEHCRQHPQLSWNILSPKMDHDKLNDFIRSKIKNRSYDNESVKYISRDTAGEEPDDTTPEFMRGPSL